MNPADDVDDEGYKDRPSRSARKRAAEYMQKLGVRLVGLREAQLADLVLPQELREPLREARPLRGQSALARQYQYIARLMRWLDPDPIALPLALSARPAAPRAKIPR